MLYLVYAFHEDFEDDYKLYEMSVYDVNSAKELLTIEDELMTDYESANDDMLNDYAYDHPESRGCFCSDYMPIRADKITGDTEWDIENLSGLLFQMGFENFVPEYCEV